MTLKDIRTRPRSSAELAADTGLTQSHLAKLRRNSHHDWPFELTAQGYVLSNRGRSLEVLKAMVLSTGDQVRIDELTAMLAAEDLKRNGNL